jgi:hypothetical protein
MTLRGGTASTESAFIGPSASRSHPAEWRALSQAEQVVGARARLAALHDA